jgi:hypothetical protein
VEEYANQKKPTDGEIYRKIRQYEGEDNEAFRERWFVRLSLSNQERLDQLDNKRNRRLRRAFDRLLAIPGLWPSGMRISVIHRLIASGCVEVSREFAFSIAPLITFLSYPVGNNNLFGPHLELLVFLSRFESFSNEENRSGHCRTSAIARTR